LTADGKLQRSCEIDEKNMNELISSFFGDPHISLECQTAGECLHYTQVPSYVPPVASVFSPIVIGMLISGGFGLLLSILLGMRYFAKRSEDGAGAYTPVDATEVAILQREASMMHHHLPCSVMFRKLCYSIDNASSFIRTQRDADLGAENAANVSGTARNQTEVLHDVQGIVTPGQVMAIMGGSGAGKTVIKGNGRLCWIFWQGRTRRVM
jgi:hypothetical protein